MTTNAANIVEEVRRAVPSGSVATRCRKERCSVPLKDAPSPRVLIDLDHHSIADQNARRCDYIFIGGSGSAWVAPMELKSGSPKAGEIVPQLQAGADIADGIVPRGAKVQFMPLAIHGGRVAPREIKMFGNRANRVRFRDQMREAKLHRCGRPLALALR